MQMQTLQPSRFGRTYRKAIMKQNTGVELWLHEGDLMYNVVHPRNFSYKGWRARFCPNSELS